MRALASVRMCVEQSEEGFGGASLPATRENCGMNTSLRENKPKAARRYFLFWWRIVPTRKWHRGQCNAMCVRSWQDQCSCDFTLWKNILLQRWCYVVTSKPCRDGREGYKDLCLMKYAFNEEDRSWSWHGCWIDRMWSWYSYRNHWIFRFLKSSNTEHFPFLSDKQTWPSLYVGSVFGHVQHIS